MKDVHLVLGVLAIAVNAAAAGYGTWCWRRAESTVWFWRILRAGQAVVVVQVALGGVLLLIGKQPGHLHVLYGVLPLAIALIAEPLRASSAQMILDSRGYESAQAVGKLPEQEQRGIVLAIIQRELGLMAIAAWVVVVLLLRAAQTA